jgi:excisionase family DNA binding protein
MMRHVSRGEAMPYSVAEAAQAIGKSKATVLRAIARGRLSAHRDEAGMFHIDLAELHRVFPPNGSAPHEAPHATSNDASRSDVAARLTAAEARIDEMQEAARLRDDTIADLRRRLDEEAAERRRLTAVLAAPLPAPRRRWWQWGHK